MTDRLIDVIVPTMKPESEHAAIGTQLCYDGVLIIHNTPEHNRGVVGSLQAGYEATSAPIIAHVHDDVILHDPDWLARVLAEFKDPEVGVVGFGGALSHGHQDIYKVPYELTQLARFGYLSNMTDALTHGERFTGACDVAVLDGFALIVRRKLLIEAGGWNPHLWPPHHLYDYVICATAHRHGYKVRLVGVSCTHLGGSASVSPAYNAWAAKTRWGSDAAMHVEGHKLFYDRFADVLPWACPPTEAR